jgi:signal transduction histidine kinase
MDDAPNVLDSLYRISSLLSQIEDPHEALELIIDEVVQVIPLTSASIVLINPDTHLLEIECLRGIPEESRDILLRPGEGVTGWVALHGKPLLVNDVRDEQRYVTVKESIRAELAVPMIDGGAVIGVVNVDSETVGQYNESHLKILTLLTNEATRVVGKLWLIRQLKIKAEQLQALVDAGEIFGTRFNFEQMLQDVCEKALKILPCNVSSIFLTQREDPETLELKAVAGIPDSIHYKETLKIQESAIGTAIRRKKLVEVNDIARTEEHHFQGLVQSHPLCSMLSYPLICEDYAIGVINVYTPIPHRFNNGEKKIFSALANLCALAVHNTQLYDRVFQSEETLRRNEKLTTLGLLSAEIAHEIRNPLTVIKLLYEGLELEYPATDMRSKDAEIIAEKLDQLEGIVSRVLSFGKTSSGLHSRWDMDVIIRDTLHLVRLKLDKSKIRCYYQPATAAYMVDGSKGQLQQVLLNLILNALEVMPNGGELKIRIAAETIESGDIVAVYIADTGSGIQPKLLNRIFDSFLTGHKDGTGLGLGIVKRILKGHHGDIVVEHTSEQGTSMKFWLPMVESRPRVQKGRSA